MLKTQPKTAPPPLVPTVPPAEGEERHGFFVLPRRLPGQSSTPARSDLALFEPTPY
jgi:hypothetical protein